MGVRVIWLAIDTYGSMTTEQARLEMDSDDFEAWAQFQESKREQA